jgi:glutamate N-acetyltransferase/amino-acid N-acetyltransferase
MNEAVQLVPEGNVTTPKGFQAGAVRVDIRSDTEKLDLGLLVSEAPCTVAAVYTSNKVKAAPLNVCRKHIAKGDVRALIANSGCANAATGEQGMADAIEMAKLAGAGLGFDPHEVLVASTGVIGMYLPMERIRGGVDEISLSETGGGDFARAIMTTDTKPKCVAARFGEYTVGGVAKGAGMIHPNMATMLAFVTTDAPVAQGFLAKALKDTVNDSFNMIDIDSDTSTNDMVAVMANGLAGGEPIDGSHPAAAAFNSALALVCSHLAKAIVADAEGGTKVIEAKVEGAASVPDARAAAKEIVKSLGVKTAIYGKDANWGRILAAVGNSAAEMREENAEVYLASPNGGEVCLFRDGVPQSYDEDAATACLMPEEVRIRVDLRMGEASAIAWGSDVTEEYVRLNSLYRT